jgi:nucleoside 2-deoxyribosyltransferase
MTAYISISFGKRKDFDKELKSIAEVLIENSIIPFVFVDNYIFDKNDEKQMMLQAMKDIDNCDFLIAETSEKAIGIGVEVGYAKAKNKPVIYLRNKNAEHSTTVSGICDFAIVYESIEDLKTQLNSIIKKII